MYRKPFLLLAIALMLVSCKEEPPAAVGQLMSDRVEIIAETSEPIISIDVTEGDLVQSGASLIRLDTARVEARKLEAIAAIANLEAVLQEQVQGPRLEVIDAAKASLRIAEVELETCERELRRLRKLQVNNLTSGESVDFVQGRVDAALAAMEYARAGLDELLAGTRIEKLEQTRQLLAQARARLKLIEIDERRLNSVAPVAGVIDSLPFENGERPPAGSVIAVMLTGPQPSARIYVPEAIRVSLQPGDNADVYVRGIEQPLAGTIRRIASEASFTPYFSLTEDDRGQLTYVAEVSLSPMLHRLPEGIPVKVEFPQVDSPQ